MVRLQKYLADCGVASRRKAEELILQGRVEVNGSRVTRLGSRVEPERDRVTCNGKRVTRSKEYIYLKIYKPNGYVSSCVRQKGEKTVLDLVPDIKERLYPVGRLDKDSEGLMLLTNDGEFANRMMHPRYEHEKEYLVNVQFLMSNVQLMNLASGIILDGKKTLPAKVKKLGEKQFNIVLKEGKKRQIRRMVEALGDCVVKLKRIRMGKIVLGDLKPGESEHLSLADA